MSDAPRQLPPKKEVAITLLEGPSLFVHLDPRRAGVLVPKWFMGQSQLVLQVGLNMAIPIPDLKVDEQGVTCTLSFNRAPFWCRMPWSAIYALVGEDGRGMVWPDDVPPEVAQQMQRQQAAPAKPSASKRPRAKLAPVEASGGEDDGAPRRRGARDDTKPSGAGLRPADGASATNASSGKEPKRLEAVPTVSRTARDAGHDDDDAAPAEGADHTDKPSARPPAGGKKPKRELPPYLRVIK
jgi:stringent starvation protein B